MDKHNSFSLRIAALEGFRSLVWELGGEPHELLKKAGVDEALWDNPDALISIHAYRAALNLAAEQTGNAQFGLLLSQRQSLEKLGAVGYAMKHAPSLKVAVRELERFLRTHDSATNTELQIDGRKALWIFAPGAHSAESMTQQTDLGIGLGVKFIRSALSQSWNPEAVLLQHARPQTPELYKRIFRCPIFFDQSINGVEFNASDLDRSLASSEKRLYSILRNHLEMLDKDHRQGLAGQVRVAVVNAVEGGNLSLDSVAAMLSFNRFQLQRRLKDEGTTYQQILEDVRFGLAQQYLRDTDLPLTAITEILGYSELAAFSRAFRRHAEQSPRAWRAEHRRLRH